MSVAVETTSEAVTGASARARPAYAWLVVVLCVAAYILSNVDRQLISVLVAPIERDLGLSDTQFGAVQGLAYGLFYAGLCIPIAALSDRFSRTLIISCALAWWSLATIACGLAQGFTQLFVARALVGMGEASLLPAVYSLIADVFPKAKLGRAMGVFFLAPFLGSTSAFLLGSAVFQTFGEFGHTFILGHDVQSWQLSFIIAGTPGIFLAGLIYLFVKEPRTRAAGQASVRVSPPPFTAVIRYLVETRRIFAPQLFGFALLGIPFYATLGWAVAFLTRTQGLTSAQAGGFLGSALLIAGCGGALLAGVLVDFFFAKGRKAAHFEVGVAAAILLFAVAAVTLFVAPQGSGPILVVTAIFCGSLSLAPAAAVIQAVAPAHFRSRISAIFLVTNLLYQTLAVFLVGVLNDHVFGGPLGIRISLPLFIGVSALGAVILLASGRKALAAALSREAGAA